MAAFVPFFEKNSSGTGDLTGLGESLLTGGGWDDCDIKILSNGEYLNYSLILCL